MDVSQLMYSNCCMIDNDQLQLALVQTVEGIENLSQILFFIAEMHPPYQYCLRSIEHHSGPFPRVLILNQIQGEYPCKSTTAC